MDYVNFSAILIKQNIIWHGLAGSVGNAQFQYMRAILFSGRDAKTDPSGTLLFGILKLLLKLSTKTWNHLSVNIFSFRLTFFSHFRIKFKNQIISTIIRG